MKKILFVLALMLAGLCLPAFSQGSEELKARFRDRLPAINALKDEGMVGENNQGFLSFVGGAQKNADVVNAENADRSTLYKAIADNTGVTPDLVGQRRALQIAQSEASSRFLQDGQGNWHRKP